MHLHGSVQPAAARCCTPFELPFLCTSGVATNVSETLGTCLPRYCASCSCCSVIQAVACDAICTTSHLGFSRSLGKRMRNCVSCPHVLHKEQGCFSYKGPCPYESIASSFCNNGWLPLPFFIDHLGLLLLSPRRSVHSERKLAPFPCHVYWFLQVWSLQCMHRLRLAEFQCWHVFCNG